MAQATLLRGSVDFSPYVAPDGVAQGYAIRQGRSIVTLDGTKHAKEIKKRTLSVTLRDMYEDELLALFSGAVFLAAWTYLDAATGAATKSFYLTGPTVRQRIARDGRTLCGGISFELEEQ